MSHPQFYSFLFVLINVLPMPARWVQTDTTVVPALAVDTIVTDTGTLYEIDRDVLLQALSRLSATHSLPPPPAERLTAEQMLRYQMLIHLLTAQRPNVGVPQSVSPYRQNPEDLSPLLRQLLEQTSRNTEQLAALQQSASGEDLSKSSRSRWGAVDLLPDAAGTAALLATLRKTADDTDKRLAAIEAQQQAIIARLQQLAVPGADALPTPSSTDAKLIRFPADFKRSVFFYVGTARLTPQAAATLDEAARFLHRFPNVLFDLRGYASPEGGRRRNLYLGRARMEAVADYLQRQGVGRSRLRHATQGKIDHGSQRQIGRRVDISLVQP